MAATTEPSLWRCPACGEVVGVYEPAISLTADGGREPGNHHGRDGVVAVYHRDCLEPPLIGSRRVGDT